MYERNGENLNHLPPYPHSSQEVVNLLLLGVAVPHVFDGMVELESGEGHKV